MNDWATLLAKCLLPEDQTRLEALRPMSVPAGHVLFRAGEAAAGFVILLEGRVEVTLTAISGREILLYEIAPGQSCIQTTLGLLGAAPYSGEGRAVIACRLVVIPDVLFQVLMDRSSAFRQFVFRAFAERMSDLTELLEKVAFDRIETRLAGVLCDMTTGVDVHVTHAELATRIGSAREVVSRQLEKWSAMGLVINERGRITVCDIDRLRRIAGDNVTDRA